MTETLVEDEVARPFLIDLWGCLVDVWLWWQQKAWPSKIAILNALSSSSSLEQVFSEEGYHTDEEVRPLSRKDFIDIIATASEGRAGPADANRIFDHYVKMRNLEVEMGGAKR